MKNENRKTKTENENRTPRPIRSDPTDRDPRSRGRARGRWVCVRILILLSLVTQLVFVRMRRVESIEKGRVESIDRKGSGRSIDRSIDRSKRVLESIDRSIEKGRSGRVGSGRVGSRWVPAARRPALRARRVDVDDERRHGTRARNSRTRGRRNFSRLSSATSRDFSRRRARTLADSHARGLARVVPREAEGDAGCRRRRRAG